jgi:hypothetical protein
MQNYMVFLFMLMLTSFRVLVVNANTGIIVAPSIAMVEAGKDASFHCYGDVEDQLLWYNKNGSISGNNSGSGLMLSDYIGGYRVLSLQFSSLTKDNEGIYCCSLSSSSCSEGKNVTLVVILPSTRFVAPSIQYVSAADNGEADVFITCSIEAGDPPPTVVWYLSGVGFLDFSEHGIKYQANYSGLVIYDFTEDDVGNYTCEYQQNLSGSFSTVIEVRLVENIIVGPSELVVGSNDVLQCMHENNLPVSVIEWTLPDGGIEYGPVLQISNVQIEDEGVFRCTLRLSNGSETNSIELEHKLFVYDPPQPSEYSAPIRVFSGTTVVLSPILKNEPHPPLTEYLWKKDGQPVESTYSITQQGSLKITNAQSEDEGTYTVIGDNGYGRTVQKFYVIWNIVGTFVELISEAQMIFDFALNTSIVPSNCEELQLNAEQLEDILSEYIFTQVCHCQVNISVEEITCESSNQGGLKLLLSGPGVGSLRSAIKETGQISLLNSSIILTLCACSPVESHTQLVIPVATGVGVPGICYSIGAFTLIIIAVVALVMRRARHQKKSYCVTLEADVINHQIIDDRRLSN